tara:strand:+ start:436 stop:699 length:264 start_codon:yes stop_codon:yes gene_type:complete
MRVVIGVISSLLLILISIYNFTTDNSLTIEAWGFLLLAPLPLAIALASKDVKKNIQSKELQEWDEDTEDVNNDDIDPIEYGYDIPVM